ncbi:MAG: hypothetical protein PHW04_14990 [Candidatus Wallbacteria bacterium]|nr:hypothetical protein [Candidatus Wallbacteria bacterium]
MRVSGFAVAPFTALLFFVKVLQAETISENIQFFSNIYQQAISATESLNLQTMELENRSETQIEKICRKITECDQNFSCFQDYISIHAADDSLRPILENLTAAVLNSQLTGKNFKVDYIKHQLSRIETAKTKYLSREEQKRILLTVRSIYGDADRSFCHNIRQGSLTCFFLEVARSWNKLYPAVQEDILKYSRGNIYQLAGRGSRAEDAVIYRTSHFEIHYTMSGEDAPAETDLTVVGVDGMEHPEFVVNAGLFLEKSWSDETGKLAMKAPKIPYQIFIKDLGDGACGVTKVEDLADGSTDSYIEIDNDFSGEYYMPNDDCDRETGDLKVTCAHEFMHACQLMYFLAGRDYSTCICEPTATWAEEYVYPEVNGYLGFLSYENSPLIEPQLDIACRTYGYVVLPLFLSEKFNPAMVKSLWERFEIDQDQTLALVNTLGDKLEKFYGDFAVSLYLKKENYEDGSRFPDLKILKKISAGSTASEVIDTDTPGYLGINYLEIDAQAPGTLNLKFRSNYAYPVRLILLGDSENKVVEFKKSTWEFSLEHFKGTVKKVVIVAYCLDATQANTEYSLETTCSPSI